MIMMREVLIVAIWLWTMNTFSSTLTSWRCPGLGPGKAKREFVEDGESEQSPRGLCDVSNTCSWKEEWNHFTILLCTWVGVEVKVKTLTMESKTTTIRSLRRRTHLTWEFYSVVVFGVEGYLSRELKLNNYLLFEIIPNTDFVARIPGQWVLRKPRFFSWKWKPWVLPSANHGEIVAAKKHFKISEASTSGVAPVLGFERVVNFFCRNRIQQRWNLCFLFSQGIRIVNTKTTLRADTETSLGGSEMVSIWSVVVLLFVFVFVFIFVFVFVFVFVFDRPNLGTNANQIPTTIYIKTDRESNLISNQCSNCHKIFASDTNIKMHILWAQLYTKRIYTLLGRIKSFSQFLFLPFLFSILLPNANSIVETKKLVSPPLRRRGAPHHQLQFILEKK